ncbi:c-type cytochrome [Geminicoccus roseus]|uniref:c-type cytochrome n=1 Tax=Geminicoccus roseus TaxID=404900 RepID=UPI0004283B1F|nr:cytochrome c family protein [Geminicoccus roseus]
MKKLALVTMGILASGMAHAEGDAAAGAIVFKKCQTCHMVGDDAKTRVGPILNGVFGRTAGTLEGYKFSPAMIAAGEQGLVWTPAVMAEYLPKPRTFIKGTKMTFPGLRDQADIDNLVAYLLTYSPNWKPGSS